MLKLAREAVPEAEAITRLVMPDDPIPECDAIVSVGHPMSYLPDEASVDRALVSAAGSLRPNGVLAIDICDLEWGTAPGGGWEPRGVGGKLGLITKVFPP